MTHQKMIGELRRYVLQMENGATPGHRAKSIQMVDRIHNHIVNRESRLHGLRDVLEDLTNCECAMCSDCVLLVCEQALPLTGGLSKQ